MNIKDTGTLPPSPSPTPIYRNELSELKTMIENLSKSPSVSTTTPTIDQIMGMMVKIESTAMELAQASISHLDFTSPAVVDLWMSRSETIAKHIKRRVGFPEV